MSRKFFKLILTIFTIFIAGCNEDNNAQLPLFGSPTKLLPNQSPVEAICKIQEEFRVLPKPLMLRMSYTSSWTSQKIAAANTHYKGFHRVHLRPEALEFLKKHSRLELVSSLVPLFIDPDVGGEAAVLLAGIPAGSDALQGLISRTIAGSLNQSGYKSQKQKGDWYDYASEKYATASGLYGLINTTSRIHKKHISEYPGSLENAIVDLLTELSHSPLIFLEQGYLHIPQPHTEESVSNWINKHNPPIPKINAQAYINKYKGNFSIMAMLPMMPLPQSQLQTYEHYMMWLMAEENVYWPAMLNLTAGNKIPNKLKQQFRRAMVERAYNICQTNKAL